MSNMKNPACVTAYTLCYQNWTVVPHHIEENFADMLECGFDTVALSFSESEFVYGRRTFLNQVKLAHRMGLKVVVVPSRWGGRMAGAPLLPSMFLARHPEAAEAGKPGMTGPIACLYNAEFRQFMRDSTRLMVTQFDVDGIIWDEPKGTGMGSKHPDAVAALGREATPQDTAVEYRNMLSELNQLARAEKSGLSITLFAQKTDPEYFTQEASRAEGMDYYGYDGNLAPQSHQLGEPKWHKYRVDDADIRARFEREAAAAGIGTFALVENMLMPASSHAEFEENLERYLSGPLSDHLSLYYYGHENEDPEGLHAITSRLMKKRLRGN